MKVEDLGPAQSPWGLRTLVVENRCLRLALLPEAGAKIYSLMHKPTGKEILWQNPRVPPRRNPAGSGYDDAWSGGWDELFPNDEPATLDGSVFPDHGELWTSEWEYEIQRADDAAVIHLSTRARAARCAVEKWIEVREGEERVRFRHRFRNLRERPLPFIWKLHPAMAVSPCDRILVPAAKFQLEPLSIGTLGGGALEWNEPVLRPPGRTVDLTVAAPPESRELHFYYGLDLQDGWCAVYDPGRQLAAGLAFPKELFTSCWVFASYGGWNDYYVAVLEPSTGYPFQLDAAAALGQCSVLAPHAELEAQFVFALRAGIPGVSRITPEGAIE
ncbi:MAG TPA: hypothetical protein VHA11_10065 [Bryobacteraceae bacterium]|nr:hypothetical protein [Bryobacteraceae bacterium]